METVLEAAVALSSMIEKDFSSIIPAELYLHISHDVQIIFGENKDSAEILCKTCDGTMLVMQQKNDPKDYIRPEDLPF